jgi:hypothetical protein
LQTPPHSAAYARPAPPDIYQPDDEEIPLFGGALSAKESPLRMRHLMALCAWAAAVTVLGLFVGLWAMLKLMSYGTPGWYEPIIILTALAGIGLEIASFITADRPRTPWILMGGSTGVLFLAIALTAAVG